MRQLSEVSRRTARALGYNQRYVRAILREFFSQCSSFLCDNGSLVLDDFGRFNVVVAHRKNKVSLRINRGKRKGTRAVESARFVKVHFSKAGSLKRLLDEHYLEDEMDKYGVDTSTGKNDEQLEKQAAEGCPNCGKKLTKLGSVVICPDCGSEPFEPKRDR